MHVPGPGPLLFLFYLLVFLPFVAIRSAQRIRAADRGKASRPLPSREAIWGTTVLSLVVLFVISWITGSGFGYRIFAVPALGGVDILYGGVTLVACLALREIARRIRPEEERRRLFVYRMAPRSPREWVLWVVTCVCAGGAEEAAYRGVGMAILWYALGNPWIAAMILSIGFALGHWTQGGRSAAIIFVFALLFHALVALTGTLVIAMVVHAGYDLVAGYLMAREVERWEVAPLVPS